jgi:asparagine synthase (glutamine-hydrolysing)
LGGIAGIAEPGMVVDVNNMLDKIEHRGPDDRKVVEHDEATLGAVWTKTQEDQMSNLEQSHSVMDCVSGGHIACAQIRKNKLELIRDQLGVAPLYYGYNENGALCFASEVKALLKATNDIHIMPPGHRFDGTVMKPYYRLKQKSLLNKRSEQIAEELKERLDNTVASFVEEFDKIGSWLSGGLDSSALTALARPHVKKLYTFSAGFSGAPDLKYAKKVAEYLGSDHHEVIINMDDVLSALPEIIYHLESFDALLVRSSINNYIVAQLASEYVKVVISGEGGDELFGGYAYLKSLSLSMLPEELIDITNRLHNTALQRVDRSASAHGTMAYVAFLDPKVVNYALRIPARYKIFNGVEKWILRKAMEHNYILPKNILNRTKSKFWKGSGMNDLLEQYAEKQISNNEFRRDRELRNGWRLNTKEELLYYRIFQKYFKRVKDLSWMGRTKGAPRIHAY